jgi:hypothetical protein
MLSFSEITLAVRATLERNSPRYLSLEQVLEELPIRDELMTQLSRQSDRIGARWAATSMVRDALAAVGAEVQFAFDGKALSPIGQENRAANEDHEHEGVHMVYRLIGGAR